METTDINLFETGSSGDFAIVNEDLLMAESLYQQVYLALFGGNIEANTKDAYLLSEERFDYWGNTLIWKNEKSSQFNSETERTIQNNALNSTGRLRIIQAINNDLEYLKSVVIFDADGEANQDIRPIQVIVAATEQPLDKVIVCGVLKDGEGYFASSVNQVSEITYMLQRMLNALTR